MEFPSWDSFKSGLMLAKEYIKDFKTEHPDLAKSIEWSFDYIPPPFNIIAKKIYSDLGGTQEGRANEVIRMLDKIYEQGENRYNELRLLLQQNTSGIEEIKVLGAKESTLITIKDILLSEHQTQNENFIQLKKDVEEIKIALKQKLPMLNAIGNLLRMTDDVTPRVEARLLNQPKPTYDPSDYKVISEYNGEVINVISRSEGKIQTITAADLLKLDEEDQEHVSMYEHKMNYLYRIWSRINRDIDKSTDLEYIAKTEAQLDDYAKKICEQLRNILDFLEEQLHLQLSDHYRRIRDVCKHHGYKPS